MNDYTQLFQKWFAEETPINAVKSSAEIGSGDDGTVTVKYDFVGTDGNSYTIEVSDENSGDDDVDLTATLTDTAIVVALGTEPDASATASIGSGTNGTVDIEVDTAGVAGNSYTVTVVEGADNGTLAAALVETDITVTLGMTTAVAAESTIGSGSDGEVAIVVDVAGSDGNEFTVEVDADLSEQDRALSATLTETALVVLLANEGDAKATASIGDGDDGVVDIEVDAAGSDGNDYTVEVLLGVGNGVNLSAALVETDLTIILGTDANGVLDDSKNTANLIAGVINGIDAVPVTASPSGDGTGVLSLAVEQINFTGGTNILKDVANTATLVEGAINDILETPFTATASGTGETAFTVAEAQVNFAGGLDFVPEDAENTATLVAAAIDALNGISATASGTGDDPLTLAETEQAFTGGTDTGDISAVKNTATLVAQVINTLDNITATASGEGTTPLLIAEVEAELEGGQFATECNCSGLLIIGDVWYFCDNPVDMWDEEGWYSGTPLIIE